MFGGAFDVHGFHLEKLPLLSELLQECKFEPDQEPQPIATNLGFLCQGPIRSPMVQSLPGSDQDELRILRDVISGGFLVLQSPLLDLLCTS